MNFLDFFNKYKKIVFILLFLAVVGIAGYFLWRLFFSGTVVVEIPSTSDTGTGGLPLSGEGGANVASSTNPDNLSPADTISRNNQTSPIDPNTGADIASAIARGGLTQVSGLSNDPTLGATMNPSGQLQYYNQKDGLFYKVANNGDIIPLSDKVFHDVKNIDWAPNGQKAVLEYPDGSKIVYDFNTKKQVTLPKHWEDFNFSPSSNEIVAKSIGLDPDNRWLIISSADGSKARAIEEIGDNADRVISSWSPNNQTVAMYTTGVDFNRQELFFIGQNGENFKSTIVEGRGITSQWSKDGSELLYSAYNANSDMKPLLWAVNAQGNDIGSARRSLEINTWASKCSFYSATEIFCAVPENLEVGSGLFPDLAKKTKDNLYKININTGQKELIAVPNGSYNVSNLVVQPDGSKLYFTDETSGKIYQVKLK
jgi:hypothetical protein